MKIMVTFITELQRHILNISGYGELDPSVNVRNIVSRAGTELETNHLASLVAI